jgi:uncharacterized repeat protein (TIGR03803 family)
MKQDLNPGELLNLDAPKGIRRAAAVAFVLLWGLLPAPHLWAATIYSFAAFKGTAPQVLLTARDGEVYGITTAGGIHGRGTVFRMGPGGTPEVLHAFSGGADGATPTALIEGKDGVLYGATTAYDQQAVDGSIFHTAGTLFEIRGRELVTLTSAFSVSPRTNFLNPDNQGGPMALALGADRALYGATENDGQGFGTLFRRGRDGALSILHSFTGLADGAQPNTMIVGGDGNFYGTTAQGGSGNGTVFRLAPDGTFTTLAPLPALAGGSATPSSLLWAADGNLYGGLVASSSSAGVPGAVFRATPAGAVTLLQRVGDSATAVSQGPRALLQSADGSFYGTTFSDGVHGAGTLFRLTRAGTLTTLYAFTGKADGEAPNALTQTFGRKPVLFGTTSGDADPSGAGSFTAAGDFGTVFRWRGGAGFETLYRFSYKHDFGPNSLVRTRSGLLYGTTAGDMSAPDAEAGTVFVITARGELRTLYRFTGGADGGNPTSLTEASDGNFYGRTSAGGDSGNGGTLFRITPRGDLTTLHSFADPISGEGSPLVEASDGNFYGTSQDGTGLVFRLTRDGAYSVLAVFPANGMFAPSLGSLLAGNDGSLYGTTLGLSGPGVPNIPGTVFKLTLAGQITTLAQLDVEPVLQFQGRDGRFYGTTSGSLFLFSGQEAGSVFAMTAQGQISTLFDFGDGASGVWPNRLIETRDGSIFGTTLGIDSQFSGPADYGSVFQLTPEGALNTLLHFDPAYPFDGPVLLSQPTSLIEGFRGVLYGTTLSGGTASTGSVFKVEEDRARP